MLVNASIISNSAVFEYGIFTQILNTNVFGFSFKMAATGMKMNSENKYSLHILWSTITFPSHLIDLAYMFANFATAAHISLNAKRIKTLKCQLNIMVDDIEPHKMDITESWSNNDVADAEMEPSDYVMFGKYRTTERGGEIYCTYGSIPDFKDLYNNGRKQLNRLLRLLHLIPTFMSGRCTMTHASV